MRDKKLAEEKARVELKNGQNKSPEERARINSELEKIFEEKGLIGLVRTHITHNQIDFIAA